MILQQSIINLISLSIQGYTLDWSFAWNYTSKLMQRLLHVILKRPTVIFPIENIINEHNRIQLNSANGLAAEPCTTERKT